MAKASRISPTPGVSAATARIALAASMALPPPRAIITSAPLASRACTPLTTLVMGGSGTTSE